MSGTDDGQKRTRGHHFVPVEDAPGPGLGPRTREVVAFLVIGFALFSLLALATFDARSLDGGDIARGPMRNLAGTFGYVIASGFTFLFGWAAWVPFSFLVAYGVVLFLGRCLVRPVFKVLGVVVFTAMLALLFAGPDGGGDAASRLVPYGPGGAFGANLSPRLASAFGGSGRILILVFGALVALMLATRYLFSTLMLQAFAAVERALRGRRGPRAALAGAGGPGLEDAVEGDVDDEDEAESEARTRTGRRLGWLRLLPWRRGAAGRAGSLDEELDDEELDDEVEDDEEVAYDDVDEAGDDAMADDADEAAADEAAADEDAADEEAERELEDDDRAPGEAEHDAAREPDGAVERATAVGPEPAVAGRAPRPPTPTVRTPRRRRRRRAANGAARQPELPFHEPYSFPPIELFHEPDDGDTVGTQGALDRNKRAIERRLASFNLPAQVVAASVGPAVTQYELRLGEGIKMSRVTAFEPDLAAALKAVAVRVVAPIPGKDTVGVEVPNKRRQLVYLRELLEQFGRVEELAIPLFLGKDVAGDPILEDLARMPHLLIAGTTGSGKSVCLNSILVSLVLTRTPQQVRLILIDPKMVELQAYRRIPHLACDVVSNMKKAPAVLEWAVDEMDRRYSMLSAVDVNHIRTFNSLGEEEIERRLGKRIDPGDAWLPYQIIVIDELADLMAVAQKDVEESIQRLAQKSRAVGLHVILATQRPSADVITGIIKANLPGQIAFKVNRKLDSRVILDHNGAEKLLGYGDMLYMSPTSGQMVRAQGTYVSDDEIQAVVRYLEEHGPKASFIPDLVQTETRKRAGPRQRDELYEQAVEVVLGQQRGSATLIQRALSVGYTRATRLLELMEEDGVVGPFVGSKSRDVLLTVEDWQAREAAIADELRVLDAETARGDDADGLAR